MPSQKSCARAKPVAPTQAFKPSARAIFPMSGRLPKRHLTRLPPLPYTPAAFTTAPRTASQAPAFNASPNTRSGFVGGGIVTQSSRRNPKRP